jgi:hypothetical protein
MTMQQPTLFGPQDAYGGFLPVAKAHRADPQSSHEAAEKVSKSAKAALHREIALAIVMAHPGHTGMELWELATPEQKQELGDHHELYRKLSDIRHQNLVRQGDARPCRIKASRMVTWFPVDKSEAALRAK